MTKTLELTCAISREEFHAHLGFPSWASLIEKTTDLSGGGSDEIWGVTELPDGRFAMWDDFELSPDRVSYYDTHNEAAEHQIAGAIVNYEDFHADYMEETGLETVVSRMTDGNGRIIGFRLSLDSDDGQHGCDARYGAWTS